MFLKNSIKKSNLDTHLNKLLSTELLIFFQMFNISTIIKEQILWENKIYNYVR